MTYRTRTFGMIVALLLTATLVMAGGGATTARSSQASTPEASPTAGGTCAPATGGFVLPVPANPIVNTSTAPGLKIDKVLVEDNVDPATGKDAADHLEIALSNESDQELSGFEVYYEITDLTTDAKEGYCTPLEGFTIPAGEQRTVHFDNTGATDHYPDNEFSLYHASKNEMQFDIMVSASGVAPQTATVHKDAGGDENPNE
ncbi:MAG TPA: hypothetical protein VM450_04180 [Thermomicrobiales bacterium]|jgi:hypothetical protein|nr:hypothetical protein [Thermomicrobiales bacterium]